MLQILKGDGKKDKDIYYIVNMLPIPIYTTCMHYLFI